MLWRSPLRRMYLRCGLLRLLAELAAMASPLCLHQIMVYLSNKDTLINSSGGHTALEGGILVVAMFAASVWQSLALQHYIALCFSSGAHAKALVQLRLSRCLVSLPQTTVQDVTAGQLTNLMVKDAAKMQDFLLFGHNMWSAPLTAAWVTISLFLVLGFWAALPGVLCTILIIPIQSHIGKRAARLRRETLTSSDRRQRALGAFIQGVRLVKFNAWERDVAHAVDEAREQELSRIRASSMLMAGNRALMDAAPVLVALCSLATYCVVQDRPLSADVAFTALVSHRFYAASHALASCAGEERVAGGR
jgi:ATP-binding cassette subfamily C (CFTR/MRP) protein 1